MNCGLCGWECCVCLPSANQRIAELERAAETSRAEHAAALGLATARIRELEGERDELLGLLKRWAAKPKMVRDAELEEDTRTIVVAGLR